MTDWPNDDDGEVLAAKFGETESFEPDEIDGYFVVTIRHKVSYETVTGTQRQLSAAAGPFGGNCEAWGVMH